MRCVLMVWSSALRMLWLCEVMLISLKLRFMSSNAFCSKGMFSATGVTGFSIDRKYISAPKDFLELIVQGTGLDD